MHCQGLGVEVRLWRLRTVTHGFGLGFVLGSALGTALVYAHITGAPEKKVARAQNMIFSELV